MDIATLLSSNLIVLLVFLVSFAIISLKASFSPYSRDWSIARGCLMLAVAGFIFEISHPWIGALSLPELCLIFGFAIDYRASVRFSRMPGSIAVSSCVLGLGAAGLVVSIGIGNEQLARAVTNGVLATLALMTAVRYLHPNLSGLVSRFPLAAGFVIIAAENLFNLGETLLSNLTGTDFVSDTEHVVYHLLTSLIYVTITGAFSLTLAFERTAMEQSLAARLDPLTGIFNRTEFQSRLEHVLTSDNRQSFALIGIDIDHFKTFNDTFGHLAGDNALKDVTRQIRSCIRKNDCLARLGGEEFAILMPDTSLKDAHQIAERIRAQVSQSAMTFIPDRTYRLTISAGLFHGKGYGLSSEQVMEIADRKLYEAKNGGRNRVMIADQAAA